MFIGRKTELNQLKNLSAYSRACLVVIRGRRRVGKSSLVAEFAKDKVFLSFTGLAPVKNIPAQYQRNAFANQLTSRWRETQPYTPVYRA